MPIKSGRYIINNVKQRNLAFLPDPNDGTPLQAHNEQNIPGEQWDVIDLGNRHHSFRNATHNSFANSGIRAEVEETVKGRHDEQEWYIQETRVNGQYTISTTDSRRFWGFPDNQEGTSVTLDNVPSDTRNWWAFKDPVTGLDAEVDERLAIGRKPSDTVDEDMMLQVVLFELTSPAISSNFDFDFTLDLVIIQETPNSFISSATEIMVKVCLPLFSTGRLQQSALRVKIIEFKSSGSNDNVCSYQRFSEFHMFDELRDYQNWELPWLPCVEPAVTSSLEMGMKDLRTDARKAIVLNLNTVPVSNGSKSLWGLIFDMADLEIFLILTLSQPTPVDTLYEYEVFREFGKYSASVLSLPSDRFTECMVEYIANLDQQSIKDMFEPDVKTIRSGDSQP